LEILEIIMMLLVWAIISTISVAILIQGMFERK